MRIAQTQNSNLTQFVLGLAVKTDSPLAATEILNYIRLLLRHIPSNATAKSFTAFFCSIKLKFNQITILQISKAAFECVHKQ